MDNTHKADPGDAPLIEPEAALPETSLGELPETLRQACARAGWQSLMPVQAKALPYLLAGRDLMVQSRTGSGKTGAFLLPTFHLLDLDKHQTQALVLCPTRELANQVSMDARLLFEGTPLKVCTVYGGVGYGEQTDLLRAGAHLVVGTPGRILDHLLRRNLSLDNIRVLIFDEADRMLSIGFYPDMKEIKRYLPRRRVSTFLFSATYPPHVLRLAEEFMEEPNFLSLSASQVHVADILHQYIEVPGLDKDRCLVRLLEIENPSSAIIFSNTKANVHYIVEVLKGFGYDAEELSADLSQSKREEVLLRLRKKNLRFLVATDVAARGLDISELSHVFQYEPPEDPESYVHRAGRTGRAGASGTAITLVNIMEELAIKRIGQRFGIDLVKRAVPTDEDVSAVVAERLTALLKAEARSLAPLKKVRLQRFLPLAGELAASDDATLLAMLLDERYQATLGDAAPEPEGAPQRQPRNNGRGSERDRERGHDSKQGSERERKPHSRQDVRPGQDGRTKETRDETLAPAPDAGKDITDGSGSIPSRDAKLPQRGPDAGKGLVISLEEEDDAVAAREETAGAPEAQTSENGERKKRRRRRRGKKRPVQGDGAVAAAEAVPAETAPSEAAPGVNAGQASHKAAEPAPAAPPVASQPAKPMPMPEPKPEQVRPALAASPAAEAGQDKPSESARKGRSRPRKPKSLGAANTAPKAEDPARPKAQTQPKVQTKPRTQAQPKAPAQPKTQPQSKAPTRPEAPQGQPQTPAQPKNQPKAPPKKEVEVEYKPDEYKGIEWD